MNDVQGEPRGSKPVPSHWRLFLVFSRIGLTSFGGGLSGWFLREFVQDRQWLSEEEFLNGLAVSQALPGVNVTNLAIWIGYRLRGPVGALAGFTGIVVPPAFVIVLLGMLFSFLARYPITRLALDGAAAAAIGLSLSLGITTARRVPRRIIPWVVLLVTFATIGLLHWPLPWVVLAAGPISVAAEFAHLRRRRPA
ncbi:MAG TPA: chromate transporter [Acidisphaera sp.]|nr:chromate transporter [Acidisphaera sp.]